MWLIILGDQITRPQSLLSFLEQNKKKKNRNNNTVRLKATVSVIKNTFFKDCNVLLSNDVTFLNEMFW